MKFCLVVAIALSLPAAASFALQTPDSEYEAVAEEYIKGYFAARPLLGTSIGLHEYDGRISDYSRLSLDAEMLLIPPVEFLRILRFEEDSADATAAPIIHANYLQHEDDVKALVQGVKMARWFGEADPACQ